MVFDPEDSIAWMSDARCLPIDRVDLLDLFFSEDDKAVCAAAAEFCSVCVAQEDCLAYALRNGIWDGIWGGKTPRQRKSMKRMARKHRAKAALNVRQESPTEAREAFDGLVARVREERDSSRRAQKSRSSRSRAQKERVSKKHALREPNGRFKATGGGPNRDASGRFRKAS